MTDNYTQCREQAALWLESYMEELERQYGYESWHLYLRTPLLDFLTGALMQDRALKRLGGRDCVAYEMPLQDAQLTNKLARLAFSIVQDWAQASIRAIKRCESEDRSQIENEHMLLRATGDEKYLQRLFAASDDIAKDSDEWLHAAIDRFVDDPPRRW